MDTSDVLTALTILAVGSGGGGVFGALVMLRKQKMEAKQQKADEENGRRSTDTEQFKAMFPGGLGEAVQVFQEQARVLYEEVSELRENEKKNHLESLALRTELESVKGELAHAKRRIAKLEAERPKPE